MSICIDCGRPMRAPDHRFGCPNVGPLAEQDRAEMDAFLRKIARSLESGQWTARVQASREKARHDFEEDAALDGPTQAQLDHDSREAAGWKRRA